MNDKIKNILEWIYCIVIAVVLALLVRYFIGTPTIVKHPSMYPTLKEDQRLWLNSWPRTINQMPERGDIITFEAPSVTFAKKDQTDMNNPVATYGNEPQGIWKKFTYYILEVKKVSYIKRVIGLPGDHVVIKNGSVYLDKNDGNGLQQLEESYLQEGIVTDDGSGIFTDIYVPENCVFVMGDNRTQSTDSRAFGCIPQEKIESKVLIRFWPLNLFGPVK